MATISRVRRVYLHPTPLRFLVGRAVARLKLLPYETRVDLYMETRPHYAYCALKSSQLAARLGMACVSMIEFGVSGGNGLVNLERHAAAAEKATGVKVEVYGFDTGAGLPPPVDYRDMPYNWKPGFFVMDQAKLRARLKSARLVLGDIRSTVPAFLREHNPAPIACMFHDTDYYSSTAATFQLFASEPRFRLPRIFNYFDDILGDETELYNEHTGELLAITEFNARNSTQKLSPCYHFYQHAPQPWHRQVYIHHDFEHPLYNTYVSQADKQSQLRG